MEQDIEYIRENIDTMTRIDIAHRLGWSLNKLGKIIKLKEIDFDLELVKMRKRFTFSKRGDKLRKDYENRKRADEGVQ